jgi:hypothetical protein
VEKGKKRREQILNCGGDDAMLASSAKQQYGEG